MPSEPPAGGPGAATLGYTPRGGALRLGAMNGWRGPGALGIALGHLFVATDMFPIERLEPLRLLVDMFFVFSGVVIAQAYSEKLRRASSIPEYVLRRFGRIWPLQAVTLAILVGYEIVKLVAAHMTGRTFSSPAFSRDGLNLVEAIPTNLLLIQALGVHDRETWNFPSWSLSVEFATYALFAAFCLIKPVLRRTLMVATIMICLAVLMFVAPNQMRSTFDFGLFRCLAGFLAGTLCFEIAMRWPPPRLAVPTLVELAAVLVTGFWLFTSEGRPSAFAAPLVFSLFIFIFIGGHGLISRVLASKPFQYLAELSFAIYMVHAIVLIVMLAAMHEIERRSGQVLVLTTVAPRVGHPGPPGPIQIVSLTNPVSKWAMTLLYLTGVLLASYLANRFVEGPGRAFFGRLGKRMSRTARVPSPNTSLDEVLSGKAP
jgi:peptidoglycan/LPS O-acetylase OafA/YrhL